MDRVRGSSICNWHGSGVGCDVRRYPLRAVPPTQAV